MVFKVLIFRTDKYQLTPISIKFPKTLIFFPFVLVNKLIIEMGKWFSKYISMNSALYRVSMVQSCLVGFHCNLIDFLYIP